MDKTYLIVYIVQVNIREYNIIAMKKIFVSNLLCVFLIVLHKKYSN